MYPQAFAKLPNFFCEFSHSKLMQYESMSTWERLFSDRKRKDDRIDRINSLRKHLRAIEQEVANKSCQTVAARARAPDLNVRHQGQRRRQARLSECMFLRGLIHLSQTNGTIFQHFNLQFYQIQQRSPSEQVGLINRWRKDYLTLANSSTPKSRRAGRSQGRGRYLEVFCRVLTCTKRVRRTRRRFGEIW